VATASWDGTARLSDDGTSLVAGSVDNTARIYRAFAWQAAAPSDNGRHTPEQDLEEYKRAYWSRFPTQAPIFINRHVRRLHALQGAVGVVPEGTVIGGYRLLYADGRSADLDVRYGRDLRDWRESGIPQSLGGHSTVAWAGPRWANAPAGETVRLFKRTYENPRPDAEVVCIEFVSRLTQAAPFLVALTLE
jgi:hypothetical protein